MGLFSFTLDNIYTELKLNVNGAAADMLKKKLHSDYIFLVLGFGCLKHGS